MTFHIARSSMNDQVRIHRHIRTIFFYYKRWIFVILSIKRTFRIYLKPGTGLQRPNFVYLLTIYAYARALPAWTSVIVSQDCRRYRHGIRYCKKVKEKVTYSSAVRTHAHDSAAAPTSGATKFLATVDRHRAA